MVIILAGTEYIYFYVEIIAYWQSVHKHIKIYKIDKPNCGLMTCYPLHWPCWPWCWSLCWSRCWSCWTLCWPCCSLCWQFCWPMCWPMLADELTVLTDIGRCVVRVGRCVDCVHRQGKCTGTITQRDKQYWVLSSDRIDGEGARQHPWVYLVVLVTD